MQVGADTDCATVSAGQEHTPAIKTTGTLWSFGANFHGELGTGSPATTQLTPAQVGTSTHWITTSTGS